MATGQLPGGTERLLPGESERPRPLATGPSWASLFLVQGKLLNPGTLPKLRGSVCLIESSRQNRQNRAFSPLPCEGWVG